MTESEVLIKTPEEAIETIKSNMPTSGYQMLRESLIMAIGALEKQNQKPLDFYGDSEDGKLLCPSCGNDLWELKECGFNNCPYCGQALMNENLEGMEK